MDIREIETEIDRLERADTTYPNCGKLATLYTIRNEYASAQESNHQKSNYSYASAPSSEFITAFLNADQNHAFRVLDEHMECIKALYPKEYIQIIRKLNNN